MSKRKDRFVVGFTGEGQVLYGKKHDQCGASGQFTEPVSEWRAKMILKKNPGMHIFEVVPYTPKKRRSK